jgi:phenylpropionate dioxygenase-like ring-hydroxylating dioxygenase large terminal subunit
MVATRVDEIVRDVPAGLEYGLRNYWYPVLQSEELPADKPIGIKRLNEDLALWRDKRGAPHTVTDRCPHRAARLSMGRILNGDLQCAFHGLRFDGDGSCVLIPWEPDDSPLRQDVRVVAYPTRELGGYIWAYLGDAARFPPPRLEEEVPEELLRPDAYVVFRMPDEVWHSNWLVTIDGSDALHAVTLHAETQAVANTEWKGGAVERPPVPLEDRRVKLASGSHGLRAISTDREGNPIHHGHLLELRGERFGLPCLTTTPVRPAPGAPAYVPRLWQYALDDKDTIIVRWVSWRARTAEERARAERAWHDVVRPRLQDISREDATIAAAQGDLIRARSKEYLFAPDIHMLQVRRYIKDAYLAQADGGRAAPRREALIYPIPE